MATKLCFFAHSGVQHILCCVFVLFFFVLCTLCFQFLWIVHSFGSPLRYSLTFISTINDNVSYSIGIIKQSSILRSNEWEGPNSQRKILFMLFTGNNLTNLTIENPVRFCFVIVMGNENLPFFFSLLDKLYIINKC
jgi:hypothetical protein